MSSKLHLQIKKIDSNTKFRSDTSKTATKKSTFFSSSNSNQYTRWQHKKIDISTKKKPQFLSSNSNIDQKTKGTEGRSTTAREKKTNESRQQENERRMQKQEQTRTLAVGSKVSGVAVDCDDIRPVGRRWLPAVASQGRASGGNDGENSNGAVCFCVDVEDQKVQVKGAYLSILLIMVKLGLLISKRFYQKTDLWKVLCIFFLNTKTVFGKTF